MAANRNYELAAERAAKQIGVDPAIFKAMIRAESNFNPNAGSPAGARGIAQFMPATAKAYGVDLNDGKVMDDLLGAAKYLKANLKQTGGDYRAALSIYNSGKPDKYKPGGYPETIAYVKKIMDGAKTEDVTGAPSPSPPSVDPATPATKTEEPTLFSVIDKYRAATAPVNPDPTNLLGMNGGFDSQESANQIQALVKRLTKAQEPVPTPTATPSNPSPNAGGLPNGRVGGGPLLELFWQGQGGINAKNGKLVPQGFVSGHKDHVHVASGPITTVRLGKLAQDMGLNVGENKKFGGVAPVHTTNSNHYRNRAIDVSGDPDKMRKYAQRVAKMYGL